MAIVVNVNWVRFHVMVERIHEYYVGIMYRCYQGVAVNYYQMMHDLDLKQFGFLYLNHSYHDDDERIIY